MRAARLGGRLEGRDAKRNVDSGRPVDFLAVQFLNGLSSASSLFLVASGLSIIFGVSRIVNFAHGSFYMLGAYVAWSIVTHVPSGHFGFWGSIVGAALLVGVIGVLVDILL